MQIVAPAGSYDSLLACINAGADAVYLGMPNFGARAKAQNFDNDALKTAIDYAHLFGVKVFVTLNTLIKDSEMNRAVEMAEYAFSVCADAAIVQDLRFIEKLKRKHPKFVLHASTQMGIHNADGAKKLFDIGISRAVLSRETLPQDIAEIKKTGIEIEYFVQGALCVCFSGNCYFSSLASSYSGNRGKCMQLCRKIYDFGGIRGYHLSAKDLCLYDKLKKLESLGVDAIKIEGRMRSPEYAYGAVDVYKSQPDSIQAINRLKSLFNRGDYCSGYFDDDARFNIIYPKMQSNSGLYIGNIDKKHGQQISVSRYVPHKNDGFKILRNGMEICGATVKNGNISVGGQCKVGDELHKTFDGLFSEKVKAAKRAITTEVKIRIRAEEPSVVSLGASNVNVTLTGDFIPQKAKTHSIGYQDIQNAFEKVSDFPFSPKIDIDLSGDVFIPISSLNELRRKAYNKLRQAILDDYSVKSSELHYNGLKYNRFNGKGRILMVESGEQLNYEIVSAVDYIVINPRDYNDFKIPKINKPILLNAPIAMRGDDSRVIKRAIERPEIFGIVSNNLYTLGISDKPILLGVGHNIIGKSNEPHIISYESDKFDSGFIYVYGYAPMMTLCHCPYGKCINCSGNDVVKDVDGRKFAMRKYRVSHCYWQLLNCLPHYLDNICAENLFFDCTTEKAYDIQKILNFDYNGAYTRGNINKGLK